MIATETMEVRNLERGEQIPDGLREGFPVNWRFDPYWSWVALVDGRIVGYLLAGAVQGVVMLLMVKSKDRHSIVLPRLFRTFLRDCMSRGYTGWMVHLNIDKPEQQKIKKIARRAGGVVFPYRIICVGGKIEDAARW